MKMTSKERVMAAINHQQTDRVPITFDAEDIVYDELHKHLGTGTKEELFDALHVDTWMIMPKNFIYPESEEGKKEKIATWGFKMVVAEYSGGTYDELSESPLAGKDDISDINNYPWPDDNAMDYSHMPPEAKAHEDRAIITPFAGGPYFIASFIRGLEDLMIDFVARKDYAHRLIDETAERVIRFLEIMLDQHGKEIDVVYMDDDFCSQQGPLFSPDIFKEFIMPYMTRVVDITHKHNKKFLLHVCGAVRPFLPMIIDAGVDILEPIQTRAEGMGPVGLKKDFGKDLCFYGGVDLQQILCKGTVQEVTDEVKRLIDVLSIDGGYIIGPGHTYIQIDAPVENIIAMYDTAYTYRG
jgi:uroporphyrinogen decarboxylase